MKFLEFLDARSFGLQAAERRFEILKFLGARRFGLRTAAELLKFTPAPRNGFRNLKFTSVPRNRFEILKFTLASARLVNTAQNFISHRGFKILKLVCEPLRALHRVLPNADKADKAEAGRAARLASQHTYDAVEKRRAVKLTHASGYLNSARRCIVRFCSAAARHGYKAGRTEKFSKFSLTNALLNSISLPPRKFKPALLKFSPAPSRNGFEIFKFMPELSGGFKILKFTLAPHKFKPASIPFLNFISNFTPPAFVAKFKNGIKFKAAAKFERSAR